MTARGRHFTGGVAPLVLALLCLLAIMPRAAQATFPGRPGLIVFSKIELHGPEAEGGLFAIKPGQEGIRQLTANPRDYDPSFAPSGRQLVFRRVDTPEPGIYLLDLASGLTTRILSREDDLDPAFGPDGMIAFLRFVRRSRSYDLILRTPDGHLRQLTSGPAREEEPFFSPNGRRIFYVRYPFHGGTLTRSEAPRGPRALFSVRVDGSDQRRVKVMPKAEDLDISPNGHDLVFDVFGGATETGGGAKVWRQRLGGGGLNLIANEARSPAYSPSGDVIAYANYEGLWVRRADGTGSPGLLFGAAYRPLQGGGTLLVQPAWQPLP